jgi:hypothetical protein
MVDLVFAPRVRGDSVLRVDAPLHALRHVPNRARIARDTDLSPGGCCEYGSRGAGWVGERTARMATACLRLPCKAGRSHRRRCGCRCGRGCRGGSGRRRGCRRRCGWRRRGYRLSRGRCRCWSRSWSWSWSWSRRRGGLRCGRQPGCDAPVMGARSGACRREAVRTVVAQGARAWRRVRSRGGRYGKRGRENDEQENASQPADPPDCCATRVTRNPQMMTGRTRKFNGSEGPSFAS